MNRTRYGFTANELIFTIIIIGILGVVILKNPNISTENKYQTPSDIKAPEHNIKMCDKAVSMIETSRRGHFISGVAGATRIILFEGGKFSLDYDDNYGLRLPRNTSVEDARSNLKRIIMKLKIASKYCDMIIEDGSYSDQERLTIEQYIFMQKQAIDKEEKKRKADSIAEKHRIEQDKKHTIRYNRDLEEME